MSDTKQTNPIITTILAIAVLALGGAFAYAVVRGAIENPSVIGPLATAAAAVIAVVIGRAYETRLQLRQKHREEITPVYRELIDGSKNSPDEGSPEFFKKWHTGLLLNAPQEVIQAWLVWSRTLALPEASVEEGSVYLPVFAATERVLQAIRKDLGHKDSGLGFGDLQRVYMTTPFCDLLFGPLRQPLPLDDLGERVLHVPPEAQ